MFQVKYDGIVTAYRTVNYYDAHEEADKRMDKLLSEGFQPVGGLVTANGRMTQAMVKYKEEEEWL